MTRAIDVAAIAALEDTARAVAESRLSVVRLEIEDAEQLVVRVVCCVGDSGAAVVPDGCPACGSQDVRGAGVGDEMVCLECSNNWDPRALYAALKEG